MKTKHGNSLRCFSLLISNGSTACWDEIGMVIGTDQQRHHNYFKRLVTLLMSYALEWKYYGIIMSFEREK
jgi:hypothetical protein